MWHHIGHLEFPKAHNSTVICLPSQKKEPGGVREGITFPPLFLMLSAVCCREMYILVNESARLYAPWRIKFVMVRLLMHM